MEMAEGKYLLRHTEHYKNIPEMVEEEQPEYEPLNISMMMSSFPGGDEYLVLFKRTKEKGKD